MNELLIMLQLMYDTQGHTYSVSTDPTHLYISKAGGGFDTVIKLKDIKMESDTVFFNGGLIITENKKINLCILKDLKLSRK
jgi:hypothetical protein